jgi:hypothetical protein
LDDFGYTFNVPNTLKWFGIWIFLALTVPGEGYSETFFIFIIKLVI